MARSVQAFVVLLGLLGYVVAPIALFWAWVRWIGQPRRWTVVSVCSFGSLLLASTSGVLAVSSIAYAQAIGGFGWYDPRLMKAMAWGLLLSLCGFVLGIGGIWHKHALRWLSLVASVGTAAFWLLEAALQ